MKITDPEATRETVYPYAEPGDLIRPIESWYVLTDFFDSATEMRHEIISGTLTFWKCLRSYSGYSFRADTIIRKSDPRYPELLRTAIRPRTWRGVDYMEQHREVGP